MNYKSIIEQQIDFSVLSPFLQEDWITQQKINISKPPRESTGFTASTIANCKRQLVYRRLYKPAVNYRNYNIDSAAEYGNRIHTIIQNYFISNPIYNISQVETVIPKNPFVSGRLDMINEHDREVVEIKTLSYIKYKDIEKEIPNKWHWQCQLYCNFMGYDKYTIIVVNRTAVLNKVFENKNNRGFVKEFTFDFDLSIINEIYNNMDYVNECVKEGLIPPPEFSPDCGFCGFATLCEMEGNLHKTCSKI